MSRTRIHIDIGGTFTDCLVMREGQRTWAKSPTTPFDLSVGFGAAVADCATALGLTVPALLQETGEIRYATTLAVNRLIERKGPRLALLATAGVEDAVLVGMGAQWADGLTERDRRNLPGAQKPCPLVDRQMVAGVHERVDSTGRIVLPLDEERLRHKIRWLAAQGAQAFVVSLLWSFLNPTHEQRVREVIRQELPDTVLGAVPVILSSEVLPKRGEYPRTMAAVVNTYLQHDMQDELAQLTAGLRAAGCDRPLLLVHNTGGLGEAHRTTALATWGGGPVAGLMGCVWLGRLYGYENVVAADMGGTTFDVGIIVGGQVRFSEFRPVIDRWLVGTSMLEVSSIGAGGGSIARLHPTLGRLEVGPESAGALPGPAAYDLGGTEPTVTDADLVLGYLNAESFHGGRRRLNRERAARTLRERIARPLGISTEEAAARIRQVVDAHMGNIIRKETVLRGHDPRQFILCAYGGAGPTHCAHFAAHTDVERIIIPTLAPVLAAAGSATMDPASIHEHSQPILLLQPGAEEPAPGYERFNAVVAELIRQAEADLAAQGLDPARAVLTLQLDMKFGGQFHVKRIVSPRLQLLEPGDLMAIYEAFVHAYSLTYSPFSLFPEGGVMVEHFVVRAAIPEVPPDLPRFSRRGHSPARALGGRRDVWWPEAQAFVSTPVYDGARLECGNRVDGPAVVEYDHTTCVVPPGLLLTVDEFLNGVMTRADE